MVAVAHQVPVVVAADPNVARLRTQQARVGLARFGGEPVGDIPVCRHDVVPFTVADGVQSAVVSVLWSIPSAAMPSRHSVNVPVISVQSVTSLPVTRHPAPSRDTATRQVA